jgi:hypothetical protein
MEELRSEIRAAFEREQAAHPPITALRRNVVEVVTAHPRRVPNYQWLAVAAALLLGILVVVGLMSTRYAHRAVAPVTHPKTSPVAGDYGPPPAGVPLIYVHDPNHPAWLIAYDWAATPRGTVKLSQPLPGVQMAPDGQSFLSVPTAKGGPGLFLDRLGQSVTSPGAAGRYAGGVWADDNRHFCSVAFDQTAFSWTLVTHLPAEAPRQVNEIARDSGVGQSSINLAACSFRHDQAIAIRTTVAWPSELWVIRLSDGKVISHHTYTARELMTVVATGDGVYIAENSSGVAYGALRTNIRRVSDWTVVSPLEPSAQVLGFNTDGSLALIFQSTSLAPNHLEVIDWQARRRIWNYDGPNGYGSFVPNQKGFAIALRSTTQIQDYFREIVIVRNDTEPLIVGRYQPAW